LQLHFTKNSSLLYKAANAFEHTNANTNFKIVEPLFAISHAFRRDWRNSPARAE